MIESKTFKAPEIDHNGIFHEQEFKFVGDEKSGWEIFKNGTLIQELGDGYTLIESSFCGICSTDLARPFLPYPLPQVIGHETVGLHNGTLVTVEINASHFARAQKNNCPYCNNNLHTHCPERITLGINALHGGFSPYFLAPVNALKKIPSNISAQTASFTEPFAAALHAVESSPPKHGDTVAVFGPRRLGMLLIAALNGFRKKHNLDFTITALIRHNSLESHCKELGADYIIDTTSADMVSLKKSFHIVYDTTGKSQGFIDSLSLAKRVVHLKSTTGKEVLGIRHLTDMVVDEISLLPYSIKNLSFTWPQENHRRANKNILCSPTVPTSYIHEITGTGLHKVHVIKDKDLNKHVSKREDSPFAQFDLAVVTSSHEIDLYLRPFSHKDYSFIRPRGAILLVNTEENKKTPLFHEIITNNLTVQTSRCGDFTRALDILEQFPEIGEYFEKKLITHTIPLLKISEAFKIAADSSQSIKVIIDTKESL